MKETSRGSRQKDFVVRNLPFVRDNDGRRREAFVKSLSDSFRFILIKGNVLNYISNRSLCITGGGIYDGQNLISSLEPPL